MGIKFGDAPAATTAASSTEATAAPVATPSGAITLDLTKSAVLDLTKVKPGLKKCVVAAGWDAAAAGSAKIDLDLSAFLCNANGKIESSSDIIYFGHKVENGIRLGEDNTTGEGAGDDETIEVDLDCIDPRYQSIVFIVNIFDAMVKKQTFGMVKESYVRLLDAGDDNKELCRFRLKDDYSSSTGVIFAKLKRNGSGWEFEAVGEGKVMADLNVAAAMFS